MIMLVRSTIFLVGSVLLGLAHGRELVRDGDGPYELVVVRYPETLACSHLSLRKTRRWTKIPATAHVTTTSAGHQRLHYITQDASFVQAKARTLCGHEGTWRFQVLLDSDIGTTFDPGLVAASQNVFSAPKLLGFNAKGPVAPPLDLEPLITSGPSSNRVNFVFFADGYTLREKSKFLDDAYRLAYDISGNQTFNTVQPLMNFWVAFTPSNESGIGTGGTPKDTPYGLYRDGTELRGVYYSKPEVARAACFALGEQCDYPILMGNDPLYGGLGGEFTVITPSLANGALVLRHELGHSVIDVGEEYDGGADYFGVNAAATASQPIPWAPWLTNASQHDHTLADARVERSVMPMQAYPWTLLNTSAPWAVRFNSSGTYARHLVRFSLSGLPEGADLAVELDGKDLGWAPRPGIGADRWHYDIHNDTAMSEGEHELRFTLQNAEREGVAQLCSSEILEFGDESEFVSKPGHYGVYPTFSDKNETSYRPTNEDCLMRQVTTPNLCKVCLEGLWLSLLRRVDLIDGLRAACAFQAGSLKCALELELVPLAHLRVDPVASLESYTITWAKDGAVLDAFANRTRIELADEGAEGTYRVDVQFATEEVRVDRSGLLLSRREYVYGGAGSSGTA